MTDFPHGALLSLPPRVLRPVAVTLGLAALGAAPARAVFTEAPAGAGVNFPDLTYGGAFADLDRDGDEDLLVCRHYFRPMVYRNLGGGSFNPGFYPPLFSVADFHGGVVADLDDDGDLDIYLTTGADAGTSETPAHLYRNDGGFSFVEVAAAWGLADSLSRGRSASVIDLEGDGDADLFVAKAPRVAAPNSLFLNTGGTAFVDIAASAGVADDFGSVGGIWADIDGDRDPDLLIGGEELVTYETRLYRNNGDLTFTDVTASALPGIGRIAAAAFGDYDGDGDLDLAVGLGEEGLFDAASWSADSLLFLFNTRSGDDGFDGLDLVQTGDSASFDLYFQGYYQPQVIHIGASGYSPGNSTPFVLAGGDAAGVPTFQPGDSTGYYLWTTPGSPGSWHLRASAPPASGKAFAGAITMVDGTISQVDSVSFEPHTALERGTRLWRNEGDGTFTEVSAAAGLADSANVRQVTWVDLDQDGRLDLYVLAKGDARTFNQPNLFYRNRGDGTFEERAAAEGLEGPPNGLGDAAIFGDADGDGDLDLVLLSGAGPRFFTLLERHRLYWNDGPVGNHLRADLEGVFSTRDGYGAWVRCVSATAGAQVRYIAGNAWRGAGEGIDPWFGLGPDAVADSLVVQWPSGARSVLTDVPAGAVTVVEPDPTGVAAGPAGPGPLEIAALPNPAPPQVRLRLGGLGAQGRLEIFDAAGRRVRSWRVRGPARWVVWDGRDAAGRRVSAGVYFARLRAGSRSARCKFVLLAR